MFICHVCVLIVELGPRSAACKDHCCNHADGPPVVVKNRHWAGKVRCTCRVRTSIIDHLCHVIFLFILQGCVLIVEPLPPPCKIQGEEYFQFNLSSCKKKINAILYMTSPRRLFLKLTEPSGSIHNPRLLSHFVVTAWIENGLNLIFFCHRFTQNMP